MSTLQDIKTAIEHLTLQDKALLAAELFATMPAPDDRELDAALERGLHDVNNGRVRPIEDVRSLIAGWITKS